MSDETYSLIMALSALGYAIVLFLRFRQGRILKRLLRSLEASGIDVAKLVEDAKKEEAAKQKKAP